MAPDGLVTASAESYAIVDSIEDVDEAGKVFRQESRKVITYGIALHVGWQEAQEVVATGPPPRRDRGRNLRPLGAARYRVER
jgi:hypothetical protein